MSDRLHNRLDQEHTDALLKNYSADYETWLEDRVAELEIERKKEIQEWRRVAGSRKGKISHLKSILEVLNTNNEIASLHDRELWSIHGELQKTINEAIN